MMCFLEFILLLTLVSGESDIVRKCNTCVEIARKFKTGLDLTAKKHFGGGNTAWEESKLGSYARSETRLVEIMEGLCSVSDKESTCFPMVEEFEENIEKFWFNKHENMENFQSFLCVETMKVCCADGFWGKDCKECPGGAKEPCSGQGTCKGSGTRGGEGTCSCELQFSGDKCDECSDDFYKHVNGTCLPCDDSCDDSCNGGTNKDCDSCADGYVENEEKACVDVNECEKEDICKAKEFCLNTEGSHECHDCDEACDGCTGAERSACKKCKAGWDTVENGCEDINECGDASTCVIGTHCVNTAGSFECEPCHPACKDGCTSGDANTCVECTDGYTRNEDDACTDVDQCAEGLITCPSGEVCVNRSGPDKCEPCHATCIECSTPQDNGCLICASGYSLNGGKCSDTNECESNPCNAKSETCFNKIGTYKCKCKHGFVRSKKGHCVPKKDKKAKNKSAEPKKEL